MISLTLLLLLFAAICFLLGAAGVSTPRPVNWTALGLFFWVLTLLIGGR